MLEVVTEFAFGELYEIFQDDKFLPEARVSPCSALDHLNKHRRTLQLGPAVHLRETLTRTLGIPEKNSTGLKLKVPHVK